MYGRIQNYLKKKFLKNFVNLNKFNNQRRLSNVANYRSRSSVSCHNRISDLVLGTNSEQSHQMVLCPSDAFRSGGNPRILVLRSSSDSLIEMAVGKDRHSYGSVAKLENASDSRSDTYGLRVRIPSKLHRIVFEQGLTRQVITDIRFQDA